LRAWAQPVARLLGGARSAARRATPLQSARAARPAAFSSSSTCRSR
jgi:hypothetical protein